MNDLERAKIYLKEHSDCTVVFARGDEIFTSCKKGVSPLLEFLDSGVSLEGFSAADKVVGRGAALLHVMLKTKSLYAEVLSGSAEEVLKYYNLGYSFGAKTERILNRTRDGFCPIEQATEGIFDCRDAFMKIRQTIARLSAPNSNVKSL